VSPKAGQQLTATSFAEVCSQTPEPCGEAGVVGVLDTASRCDHAHQAVGNDTPKDVSDAAEVGTKTLASRMDHVHKGVGSDTPKDGSDAAEVGTNTLASRQDHVHKAVGQDTPKDCSDGADVGTKTLASRQDHIHKAVGQELPQDVAAAADVGTEKLASRQDHKHRGVAKIVAGTGIEIDPSDGYGTVTITCTLAGVKKAEYDITAADYDAGTIDLGGLPDCTAVLGFAFELDAEALNDYGNLYAIITDDHVGETLLMTHENQWTLADGRQTMGCPCSFFGHSHTMTFEPDFHVKAIITVAAGGTEKLRIYSGTVTVYYV